jgi:outer membrane protein assembly factor BamB
MRSLPFALITLLFAAACENPPATVANRCVDEWPASPPGEGSLAQPIGGVTPGTIVWHRAVTHNVIRGQLLWTPDLLYMTGGGRIYLLDHAGHLQATHVTAGYEGVGSATVDDAGNVYYVGENVYSVDKQGNWRFITPIDPATNPFAGGQILRRDDTIFFTASDGDLYAVDTSTGMRLWRREVGKNIANPAAILGGVGNAILVITRGTSPSSKLYDVSTGAPIASFTTDKGDPTYGEMIGGTIGIVTERQDDTTGPYPWMHISALDPCSRPRWTIDPSRPQWPALIAPNDDLLVVERDDVQGSPTFVSRYSPDGTKVVASAPAAPPWAIGADGTIYGVTCDSPGYEGPSRLIAYDPSLHELWRLELGPSCPTTTPVIGDDGIMYFGRWVGDVTDLIAVQTSSPGLAKSGWPTRRHDALGTGWVK